MDLILVYIQEKTLTIMYILLTETYSDNFWEKGLALYSLSKDLFLNHVQKQLLYYNSFPWHGFTQASNRTMIATSSLPPPQIGARESKQKGESCGLR